MTLLGLPDTSAVPSPLWLLTVLHLLTLLLHLVAMSTLLGGLVTVLAIPSRGPASPPGARRIVALLPTLLAATATLGVAPLLFLQLSYGRVAYAAAVTTAWAWLAVPFLAMAAYGLLYGASHRVAQGRAGVTARLVAALCGLLAIALVYSATFALAERPGLQAEVYARTASGFAWNPAVATWLPRFAQAVAAAIALGAVVARLVGRDDDAVRAASARVLVVAALATAAAAGARLAFDASLARNLGPLGLVGFVAGALAPLAAVALARRGALVAGATVLVLGLAAALVARHVARLGALAGAFDPGAARVEAQWGLFALFVLFLLVAIATIAWMLRAWARGGGAPADGDTAGP